MPQAASASRVCCPAFAGGGVARVAAVREKRGAGAGWAMPSLLDEGAAGAQVRVLERLGHRQDRRDAGVGALEDLDPLGLGALPERVGDQRAQLVGTARGS